MGSDNLINDGTNGTSQSSDEISSPVVKAIASHVGRYYPPVERTHVEKTSSVNHSTEVVFEVKHEPVGFDNIFSEKRS